jgi:VWFA-related protein
MKSLVQHSLSLIIGIVVGVVFVCQSARAQQHESEEVIRINADVVLLDAQVLDRKTGRAVGDLKQDEFELYEDGVKQQIAYFGHDELPLSILLLLDVSGSVRPIVRQIADGAREALDKLKPADEVAVMAFAEEATLVQGFTRDHQLIADQIKTASEKTSIGRGTFLAAALYEAAREMPQATNPASRRVIIVVTDNIAVASKRAKQRATTELFESGTVVCGLIVRGGFGKTVNVMTLGLVHGLNPFADETGGELINADKKEVDTKLADLLTHLRTRYTLGYKPQNTQEDGKLRRIKLQLTAQAQRTRGKLAIRTKQGYYFRRRS